MVSWKQDATQIADKLGLVQSGNDPTTVSMEKNNVLWEYINFFKPIQEAKS